MIAQRTVESHSDRWSPSASTSAGPARRTGTVVEEPVVEKPGGEQQIHARTLLPGTNAE